MGCRCAGLERSEDWQLLEGSGEGTSQIHMSKGADPLCTFDHPLDVRLHCGALAKAAAPRIKVEVYQLDELDRLDIAGYGMVHLPLSTGAHALEIHCWRPAGSWYENLSAKFIGGYPRLVRPQLVVSAAERFGMATETTGTIYCTLNVLWWTYMERSKRKRAWARKVRGIVISGAPRHRGVVVDVEASRDGVGIERHDS